jgi:hypothetical protein
MLTEEEKNKIREEEIYRQEVRQQLESEKPKLTGKKKLWEAINKPFILWCLSSIAIGFISWMYSSYQAREIKSSADKATERKIDEEAVRRLDLAGSDLVSIEDELVQRSDYRTPESIFTQTKVDLDDSRASLYPEFEGRKFNALLAELRGLTSSPREIDELKKAISSYEALDKASSTRSGINTNTDSGRSQDEIDASIKAVKRAEQLLDDLTISRWSRIAK